MTCKDADKIEYDDEVEEVWWVYTAPGTIPQSQPASDNCKRSVKFVKDHSPKPKTNAASKKLPKYQAISKNTFVRGNSQRSERVREYFNKIFLLMTIICNRVKMLSL